MVTTGTFGPMCSSGFMNIGHSKPRIKVGGGACYLNDVPCYCGIAAVRHLYRRHRHAGHVPSLGVGCALLAMTALLAVYCQAADVEFYALAKAQDYAQLDSGPATLSGDTPFRGGAFLFPTSSNSVVSATLGLPAGTQQALAYNPSNGRLLSCRPSSLPRVLWMPLLGSELIP